MAKHKNLIIIFLIAYILLVLGILLSKFVTGWWFIFYLGFSGGLIINLYWRR